MPGNLRTNLRAHLSRLHSNYAATRLQATTRSQIHHAISSANKELEKFGYYIAIVTDTGSMISAKVYGQSFDRDFDRTVEELTEQRGYPINLQLSPSGEDGMAIYSYRGGGRGQHVVTSRTASEINDAIHAELESQIKAGIDAAQTSRR
jgi:hypothetical protein